MLSSILRHEQSPTTLQGPMDTFPDSRCQEPPEVLQVPASDVELILTHVPCDSAC